MKVVIIWFRRDLRLEDNTALSQAISYSKQKQAYLLPIFQIDPYFVDMKYDTSYEYFFKTLSVFANEARQKGLYLHLFYYQAIQMCRLLMDSYKIDAVFYNRDEAGYGAQRDHEVSAFLRKNGIHPSPWTDAHLHGAGEIVKQDGSMYKVFTPYFRAWSKAEKPKMMKLDDHFLCSKQMIRNQTLSKQGEQVLEHLVQSGKRHWEHVDVAIAKQALFRFLDEKLAAYHENRDFPFVNGTSKLSCFLKTGVLSPRMVYYAALQHESPQGAKDVFIKELAWRDFYNMVYAAHPYMAETEIDERFRNIRWNHDQMLFKACCEGRTGFPIVDAGMRQLNKEGWMHNRLRMITASFLVKDFLIDWRLGEAYFSEKLIDYDPASNIGGWQWAASVGTDAVPYFRIFNPVTQSKKFDPDGLFIRRYIPELQHVPDEFLHEPWKMPIQIEESSSCIIGEDYPKPLIDHQVQRRLAIETYETAKNM
ncbi:cryptochrome/photolyase family protein [Bacillus cabrialesii]|uniref:cryptochrome/photolyase family protein n=1 Tax=Bacillus cabrialesii TaxID=2487276 RepID=UPI0028F8A1F1|nr:deoxyribodipyrimidine photo-lyase [Bacillus cabrialesii]MDU0153359.1 deoxyribodipyrimidine photo-lyase [Bacillus cabrialesii]